LLNQTQPNPTQHAPTQPNPTPLNPEPTQPNPLVDKMEDWVERLHQTGMQMRQRFRTVQNPIVRATAREKVRSRNSHPDVIAKLEATNEGNKRKFIAHQKKRMTYF